MLKECITADLPVCRSVCLSVASIVFDTRYLQDGENCLTSVLVFNSVTGVEQFGQALV